MQMSDTEYKLKETNKIHKDLFNSNGAETQLKNLKEVFTRFIKNSKNRPDYFIKLIDYYSTCRPYHHNISKELIECVCSCFPDF